ncbi:lysophospholipid acyltransferase family protein [Desulfuromonas carbonis]|uniref:lysophospholipid acyltransferase family protein n=1 Tax=Desulfuromonas sp. DDH964 TaxID=1823759 RepID=UPI00078B24E9|nr:lysophospholipid acyltransferase family protein [Desulfuromonas sp. DDH964]AMV72672.1 hypothetical protein DBW_2335 [Desulfuromonas sp. DDH964]
MKSRLGEGLLLALAPALAAPVILLLHASMRIEIRGEEGPRGYWDRGERVILASWHDQLLMMPQVYHGPGAKVLISASRDGELLTRTLKHFGLGTVRGSSSRGGREAFREMVELGRQDFDLGITPDGPKGPRHRIKPGVGELARITGRPVIPLAFACSRGHRFASWDRFLLPYPFSRAIFRYAAPVCHQRGEDREAFLARLQEAMEENDRQARACLEAFGVSAV